MVVSPHDYWTFVGLNRYGRHQKRVISPAQEFFGQQFGGSDINKITLKNSRSDREIQQRLTDWFHLESGEGANNSMATLCLRCFVSNSIYQACTAKVSKFGQKYNFSLEDILPLVLDHLPLSNADHFDGMPKEEYSLTTKILKTFEPTKSNLSTWTSRRVTSHGELKRFFLEQGLEEVSDWVLLNTRTPSGLAIILKHFFPFQTTSANLYMGLSSNQAGGNLSRVLTETEINTYVELLNAYHQAYRDPILELRRQQGVRKQQRYPQPTEAQLQMIARLLEPSFVINR